MNNDFLKKNRILSKFFKTKKETRHVESFYRSHFESANTGMMILDTETGNILDVNPYIVELLGLTKKDFSDKEIWKITFFKEIFENKESFNKLFQKESIIYKEILLETKNGQQINVEFSCNVVVVDQKKVIQCSIKDITKRKQAEIALRKNELYLNTLMHTIPELIWLKDTEGVYLSCNAMVERYFGVSEKEIIGKNDYDFIDKELADSFRAFDRKVMVARKSITNGEWVTYAHDGHRVYLETIKTPMFDSQGVLIGVLGIGRDFTERKLIETNLLESEGKFKSIYEGSNDAIMLLNENGYFDCNPRTLKIFGIKSKEEFVKLNPYVLSPLTQPDGRNSREAVDEYIRIAYKKGINNFDWNHLRSNGELFPTKVFLSVFYLKGDRVLQVTVRDLSKKERELIIANKELAFQDKEKEKRAAELSIANAELVFQNKEKEKRAAELIIANTELLFQNKEKEKRAAELGIANAELVFQNKEKEKRAAELIIANTELAFQNKEKEKRAAELSIANTELVFQNQEKEKRAAELIIAKENAEESDKLKTAFLQNMSHEIRTPLNGIIGFSTLLNDEDISRDEIKEFTAIISQSGKRLVEIVNNVLDISKIQTGQIEVKNTSILINIIFLDLFTFFSPIATAKNISLNYNNLDDKFRKLFTDEAKLHQILTNLINNAIKFTKSGSIDFGYEIKENIIQLYVKDTGIGLPKESFERIFDRFIQVEQTMTKNYEGAGLGLAISKGLVELLGGKIWVESEIDKGTTFYFTLPYCQVEAPLLATNELLKNPVKQSRGHILIVEDDWTSFQYLKRILVKKDIIVLHVENGLDAIAMVKNTPDINLILMDIRMPVMDGIESTKQIKKLRPDLPIIAQTAYAFEDEKNKILAIGCDEYLTKPLKNNKLHALIDRYLN
jgi:PAS domain S-box-containing protein